jgi:NAD(P)-dependent dehydrogenase (short-subunit alcohol dehydrogenase family)
MRLEGKVAVITGAGSGLGRASALLFAGEGARVVVADIVDADGEETVRLIRESEGEALFVHVDVSRADDCEKMVRSAVDSYGRLDIMFNNAGVPGAVGAVADLSEDDWNQTMSVNVTGVFLGTKYAVAEMLKAGGGVIVNTSSAAAIVPTRLGGAYGTSKAAIVGLTKATAMDYARKNIRANCILPGPMETAYFTKTGGGDPSRMAAIREKIQSQQPSGRFAQPEEVARVALFLASDESSFMTGAAVAADGGRLLV